MKLSGKINSREFIPEPEVRELVYVIFQASSAPRQKQGARRRFVGGPNVGSKRRRLPARGSRACDSGAVQWPECGGGEHLAHPFRVNHSEFRLSTTPLRLLALPSIYYRGGFFYVIEFNFSLYLGVQP